MNENLTLLENNTSENDIRDKIIQIKMSAGEYRSIIPKLRKSFELLNHYGHSSLEDKLLQEYSALAEVRNAIIHYCPEYIDFLNWPERLKQAFHLSGVEPTEADWTVTFRSKTILEWARRTSKSLIESFLPVTKINQQHFFGD